MKIKNKSVFGLVLSLAIIIIYSCNFPGFSANNESESLRQTVQALSTSVANKEGSTPGVIVQQGSNIQPTGEDIAPSSTPDIPPTPIPHNMVPAQPGWVARWFTDTDSSRTAAENRAPGGDNFSKNIYERPFTAAEMVFRPDIDINKAEVSSDNNFIYLSLYLHGTNPEGNNLKGNYGVELDTDYDGRGNYLILVSDPSGTEWKMENVTAYQDTGKKVGGAHPMSADSPSGYVGYDQTIFSLTNLSDPDAAWGRVSPKGSSIVEVAFKRSLIGGSGQFLWSVWADDGVKDPGKYDYNDHFTLSEAGSPYKDANYPLKSMALVDSTCREVFNFTPTGDIPGLCALPPTITPSPEPTHTPRPQPGGITGMVFSDNNNNGHRNSGEGPWCTGVTVWYHVGPCSSAGPLNSIHMGGGCAFSAGNLPAGQYCVSASGYEFTTPRQVTVNVPAGGNANVLFGIYVIP
jgi:hypothetical protein